MKIFWIGLRCYECRGTGLTHACMVRPSNVSKEVMCQPNESCYVERQTVEYNNSTSTNSTGRFCALCFMKFVFFFLTCFLFPAFRYTVSRGCRAASSDDSAVIRYLVSTFCSTEMFFTIFFVVFRKDNLLGMSCRLSDFCNSINVNKLIRSNSAAGNINV